MGPEAHGDRDLLWEHISRGRLNAGATLAVLLLERLSDPADLAQVHAALGVMLQRVGRLAESRDRFHVAAGLAGRDKAVQASYLADAAGSRVLLGDLDGAADDAARARLLGDRHGNRFAACEALNSLAMIELCAGRPAAALRLTKQGTSLQATETESRGGPPMSHLYHGIALIELDRFAEADEAFTEGLHRSTRAGADSQATWYHTLRGLGRYLSGRWDDALVDAHDGLDAAERTGTQIARPYGHAVAALVRANRADQAPARGLLAPREGELTALGLPGGDWLGLARAATATDSAGVYAALLDGWLQSRRTPMLLSWRSIAPNLVRQAIDHGSSDLAREVLDAARLGAERADGVPSATAAALHATALAERDAEAGRACIDEYRRSGRPFSLAVACVSVALMLEEEGDHRAALAAAREAVEAFTALRATYWVARAGRVLQRLTPSSPAPTVPQGWELLTESERQVARLVARGLTNPEIAGELVVSPRTVQSHTSRIYAKLGISSRAQLAGLVRDSRA